MFLRVIDGHVKTHPFTGQPYDDDLLRPQAIAALGDNVGAELLRLFQKRWVPVGVGPRGYCAPPSNGIRLLRREHLRRTTLDRVRRREIANFSAERGLSVGYTKNWLFG